MINFIINSSLKEPLYGAAGCCYPLALAGLWSFKNMPLDAIPDLSDVQVIVFTEFSGYSRRKW